VHPHPITGVPSGWSDPDPHELGLLGRACAGRGRSGTRAHPGGLGRASRWRGQRALRVSSSVLKMRI
jgi:hypothetical protein